MGKLKVTIRKPVVIQEDVVEAAAEFNAAFNQINSVLVEREHEIEAVKLAILTESNLLLEGRHGTAKSKVANEVFKRIEGDADHPVVFFKKQLMKGTQPDELFGPMKSKKYREEAIWEHNIEGMLPSAHFAFIDEVYRGSEMLLPSILGILNEKEFMNGTQLVNCPLITAIGTTNFITDTPDLEAFHDRWLLRLKVQPLKSSTMRHRMLTKFLDNNVPVLKKVRKKTIDKLRRSVKRVSVESECIELYEEIVDAFAKKSGASTYISDRRLCLALRLAQAALLINKPGEEHDLSPVDLFPTIYGIVTMGEQQAQTNFTECCQSAVDGFAQYLKENETVRMFEEFASEKKEQLRKNPDKDEIKSMYKEIKDIASGLSNMSSDERPQKQANQERLTEVSEALQELLKILAEKINKT